MKQFTLCFFFIFGIYTFNSCTSIQPEEIICSTISKTIEVTINGQELDSYYTIRISSQDTIRSEGNRTEENFYPILSDLYHTNLINKKDSFHFVGLVNDSIIVIEPYLIGGDDCHIYLQSGPTTINL